ncbi:hypothetical protein TNIN_372791 [Trichonephila inaurata madagascariensis]|uniref:Uncharacterized protein n=1 Tax=Trichonephila inaurata madagascariensis TaxID=2747483 RepID=A0A8X7BSY6_9ARAC|nr:hypothetical protein TNIN_372791 [Trichonephila inaurata madagascariensis]
MCVGHSDTQSFTEQKKECKPCQRASVEALLSAAHIQVAPCFGLCEMIRGQFCASLFPQNNVFNLTTDIRNAGRASAQQPGPSDPSLGPPTSQGNDTSRKVSFHPFCSSGCLLFQHLSSHFGAFNSHQ